MELRKLLRKRAFFTLAVIPIPIVLILSPTIALFAFFCGILYGYWLCFLDEHGE